MLSTLSIDLDPLKTSQPIDIGFNNHSILYGEPPQP